ncbi:MAG TPA: hypothetical protein VK191_14895 [Symbiobacteriaceae bacterium]|nr:hypothetical protein [Symbiobacteriaceae bacterium]
MVIDWSLVRRGAMAGLGALFLLLAVDRLTAPGHVGWQTLLLGFGTAGLLLLGGLGMAGSSYWLVSQGRSPALRQRLLRLGLFCGTAGFLLSVGAFGAWLALGRPGPS